ncbi:MAG: hypothetical protein OFPI_14790 [Osedax symbiont Rs2]|nr:MAG: hypothetical protein OFPI_14790 [Osedax symbiont Rs2]
MPLWFFQSAPVAQVKPVAGSFDCRALKPEIASFKAATSLKISRAAISEC